MSILISTVDGASGNGLIHVSSIARSESELLSSVYPDTVFHSSFDRHIVASNVIKISLNSSMASYVPNHGPSVRIIGENVEFNSLVASKKPFFFMLHNRLTNYVEFSDYAPVYYTAESSWINAASGMFPGSTGNSWIAHGSSGTLQIIYNHIVNSSVATSNKLAIGTWSTSTARLKSFIDNINYTDLYVIPTNLSINPLDGITSFPALIFTNDIELYNGSVIVNGIRIENTPILSFYSAPSGYPYLSVSASAYSLGADVYNASGILSETKTDMTAWLSGFNIYNAAIPEETYIDKFGIHMLMSGGSVFDLASSNIASMVRSKATISPPMGGAASYTLQNPNANLVICVTGKGFNTIYSNGYIFKEIDVNYSHYFTKIMSKTRLDALRQNVSNYEVIFSVYENIPADSGDSYSGHCKLFANATNISIVNEIYIDIYAQYTIYEIY